LKKIEEKKSLPMKPTSPLLEAPNMEINGRRKMRIEEDEKGRRNCREKEKNEEGA